VGQGAQVNDPRRRCWGLILTLNRPPTHSAVATPHTEINLSLCIIGTVPYTRMGKWRCSLSLS
jgi:hypothetical protein